MIVTGATGLLVRPNCAVIALSEPMRSATFITSADLVVANTLEERTKWAWLGPVRGDYLKVGREDLPGHLLEQVERIHEERRHG